MKTGLLLVGALVLCLGCSGSAGSSGEKPADGAESAAGARSDGGAAEQGPSVQKQVTFVELGSVNCVPCRMMQPVMEEVEREYGDRVDVVFYDVWTAEGRPYAKKYGVRAIPTQVFLDEDGNEYFRHEGFLPKEEIVRVLKAGGVE